MKEVMTTLAATAALLVMSVSLAGCAHLVPEKQTHISAKSAVQHYMQDQDTSVIVEGSNSQAGLLV